jgi:putative oxidoreductase
MVGPDVDNIRCNPLFVCEKGRRWDQTITSQKLRELAVLLGALVPLASIPMAIVLLTAMFTVHLPYGFSSIKLQAITAAGAQFGPPGYETDLLYLACLAALVLGGSGPLSIDRLLADRTSEAAM